MKSNLFRILIITFILQGCATAPKGWNPTWIEEEGKALCPKCNVKMNYVPVLYDVGKYPYMVAQVIEKNGAITGETGGNKKSFPVRGYICPKCNDRYLDTRKMGNPCYWRVFKEDRQWFDNYNEYIKYCELFKGKFKSEKNNF